MSNDTKTIATDIYAALQVALADYDLDILDMIAVLKQVDNMIPSTVTELVADARHGRNQATWDQIGGALGVSKQAAQQAYWATSPR